MLMGVCVWGRGGGGLTRINDVRAGVVLDCNLEWGTLIRY